MKNVSKIILIALIIWIASLMPEVQAQKKSKTKKKDKTEAAAEPAKDEDKSKSIEEVTKSHIKSKGLFTVYQDSASGSLKMLITKDQLDKEYIHFYYFDINFDSLQGSAQVATEIYCGKLFLLFKYYVCRVYSYLPAGIVPDWFKIHSERELHIKMELH